jgi:hypothetical protein
VPFVVEGERRETPALRREDPMTRYLLSVHTIEGDAREPMTEEEMQRSMKEIGELEAEMKSSGAWVSSARLHGPDAATVVRVSGGKVLTTDGPFAETKEQLGGFYIIEAEDLDAALGWASKVTQVIDTPVEVRPFADFADEPRGWDKS